MAQRNTDVPSPNGTPPAALSSSPERERERRAAESPPGSRERSESDVSGWSPERDESPEVREGRFHRAAQLRMAQPRTEEDAHTPWGAASGPYGRDDRAEDDAAGMGAGPLAGEHDRAHSLDTPHTPREYRPWDREGGASRRGAEEPRRARSEPPRSSSRGPNNTGAPRAHDEPGWTNHEPGWDDQARERRDARPSRAAAPGGSPLQRGEPRSDRGRWHKEPLTAREIMTRQVKSVRPDSSLRDVARVMKEEDCGIVPVVDERGRLKGVLTDRDLVVRTLAEGRSPDTLHVRDIMTEDVEAVTPDEDVHALIALMGRHQVRRIPVVERDDRLVGIISMADIATRADHDQQLQEALDRISSRRSFWSRLY